MKKNILNSIAKNDTASGIKKKRFDSTQLMAWLFILPSIVFLYITIWRPVGMGAIYSFFKLKGFTPVEFVGFDNYVKVLTDTNFTKALLNTVQYVLWEIVLGFVPPVFVAIMLNEIRGGHRMLKFAIYFPTIVPGVVSAMMWRLMYEPNVNGLINNILSRIGVESQLFLNSPTSVIFWICLSACWGSLGGNMIYYLAGLQGINSELYEAASIEGAGIFKRMWHITLPQMSGLLLLFVIRLVIKIFQTFEAPLMMTDGGPNGASMTLGLQSYRYAFENFKIEYALALGMVMFVILIGITIFYFRLQNKIDTE